MDISSNPVTESEMRQFAERMVTSFVSLSEQSRELANLKFQFSGLESRVNSLVGANERLQAQVETLVVERDKARQDALDNNNLAVEYSRERDEARKQLQDLQSRFDALQHNKEQIEIEYRELFQKNQENRTEAAALRQKVKDLETDLSIQVEAVSTNVKTNENLRNQVTEWSNRAYKAETALSKAEEKLAKVQAVFAVVEEAGSKPDITQVSVGQPKPDYGF